MKQGHDYIGVGVGAFIINDKNEFLMLLRSKDSRIEPGTWMIPGGAVDFNEKIEDAVKREIKEEIGVDIKVLEPIRIGNHIWNNQHWVAPSFKAVIITGEPKILEPNKHQDLKWFKIDGQMPENLSKSTKDILNNVPRNRKLEFISTVFIVKDKKVLLLFNKKLNNWTPPGGHIEHGEKPCESAIREAKEETGYGIEILGNKQGDFLHTPHSIHLDKLPWDHDHINLIYFAKITGGQQLEKTDEDWEMKWFSEQDLENTEMFPNVKSLGKQAINKT